VPQALGRSVINTDVLVFSLKSEDNYGSLFMLINQSWMLALRFAFW
jgi:hypothetical protein